MSNDEMQDSMTEEPGKGSFPSEGETMMQPDKDASVAVPEKDVLDDALDAALAGDENVDLIALVRELFETVGTQIETHAVSAETAGEEETQAEEPEQTEPTEPQPEGQEHSEQTAETDSEAEASDPETGADSGSGEEAAEDQEAAEDRGPERKKRGLPHEKLLIAAELLIALAIIAAVSFGPAPKRTQGLHVVGSTYNSTLISWDEEKDVDGYRVYRSVDGKNFDYIGMTDETSYSDNNIRTGTTYYYAVTSKKGVKSSKVDPRKTVKVTPHLEKPQLEVTTDNGTVELSFSPVSGASGYQILRDGKEVGTVGTSDEMAFTDESASGDTDYEYEVKAFRYKKDPVYSGASNMVTARLETIGELVVETVGDGLSITWDPSDVYTTFKIYEGDELLDTVYNASYSINSFELDKIYDIRITGYSEDEKKRSPEEEKKFRIAEEPLDNAGAIEAACEWGVEIANDDSFAYGVGDRAHHSGCYFCGTNVGPNMYRKGSSKVNGHSYAKTYCCNPFVHACYAHGAGDPNMLAACRRGKSVGMKESTYTRYGNWKNVGKPSYSDLKRGDVIVKNSHVMLYLGDGQIVHAATEGWGPSTITVAEMSRKKYSEYSFVMRYTGTGSGTMYVVKDVDDEGEQDQDQSEAEEQQQTDDTE